MSTWILVFYMSTSTPFNFATGGPAVIEGFSSYAKCETAKMLVSKLPKYDWSVCFEVVK